MASWPMISMVSLLQRLELVHSHCEKPNVCMGLVYIVYGFSVYGASAATVPAFNNIRCLWIWVVKPVQLALRKPENLIFHEERVLLSS